jgi:hypothetical protein
LFRCFSATAEAAFPSVRRQRQHNFDLLKACDSIDEMVELLTMSIRPSYAPFRIHVGGEFFNQTYFDAWCEYARQNPNRIFYAYTKSLPYWVARIDSIPANLSLTASRGGRMDHLIDEHGLKEAVVVFSESEAEEKNLEIDHDDNPIDRANVIASNFAPERMTTGPTLSRRSKLTLAWHVSSSPTKMAYS